MELKKKYKSFRRSLQKVSKKSKENYYVSCINENNFYFK